jgi:holliday junction DNA helicase RuvA
VIGSLRGTVLERRPEGDVLLEVSGVGYFVHVTPRTLAELEPGSNGFLHIHHHIREDAQTLFGFLSRDERSTFQTLLATHGVGPSMAMAILATHSPSALVDIVTGADIGALTLVPGVGKKTAERLLIELKNRLNLPMLDISIGQPTSGHGSVVGDVREALLGLGYAPEEVAAALREVPGAASGADAPTLLRDTLKVLGARRA